MTILVTISFLFAFHWVADFICQTDWMATNKSKNWGALTLHVFTYSVVMMVLSGGYLTIANTIHPQLIIGFIVAFGIVTFITHFITDAITSRITSYLWMKGDRHNFFVIIGLDQLIHALTLIWSWYIIQSFIGI